MLPTQLALYLLAFCRVVMGLVFLVSSIGKARDLDLFRQTIRTFHILPPALSGVGAIAFICGEFAVVAVIVIGGPLLMPGFLLAAGLLVLFSIALVSVLLRRIRTSCNCFGTSAKAVSPFDVWRNVGFILCALVGGALTWTKDTQENLSLPGWMLSGLGAVVFVVIWLQLREIAQFFRQG